MLHSAPAGPDLSPNPNPDPNPNPNPIPNQVGPDLVVWNLHRRYGPLRLPMLLGGWAEAARLGWEEERLAAPADHRRRCAPPFVLPLALPLPYPCPYPYPYLYP